MDDRLKPAYDLLMEDLESLQKEVEEKNIQIRTTMQLIDRLLIRGGEKPQFGDCALPPSVNLSINPEDGDTTNRKPTIKPGEFYGKPLLKAIRIVFSRIDEEALAFDALIEALKQGGHSKVKTELDVKKVRANMFKSGKFALLPNDHFILKSKDILRKEKREKSNGNQQKNEIQEDNKQDVKVE